MSTLQEQMTEFQRARRQLRDAFIEALPRWLGRGLVGLSWWLYGRPEDEALVRKRLAR